MTWGEHYQLWEEVNMTSSEKRWTLPALRRGEHYQLWEEVNITSSGFLKCYQVQQSYNIADKSYNQSTLLSQVEQTKIKGLTIVILKI